MSRAERGREGRRGLHSEKGCTMENRRLFACCVEYFCHCHQTIPTSGELNKEAVESEGKQTLQKHNFTYQQTYSCCTSNWKHQS